MLYVSIVVLKSWFEDLHQIFFENEINKEINELKEGEE